jgi:hypothetical protein
MLPRALLLDIVREYATIGNHFDSTIYQRVFKGVVKERELDNLDYVYIADAFRYFISNRFGIDLEKQS